MGREKKRFHLAAHKKKMDNPEENKPQCNGDKDTKEEKRKHPMLKVMLIILLLLLLCLCFRSCRARDEPLPEPDRIYEEDYTPDYGDVLPSAENGRLNLALSKSYHITDEHPVFYIGFPEENVFDVVLTLRGLEGDLLYQTDLIAPGTNTAINGTEFLQKGTQQMECLVSVYEHDSGVLVSDCITVILNISYEE